MRALVATTIAVTAMACSGSTGSHLSTWSATASGVAATNGASLAFTNNKQAAVELTRAYLYVGAVYLNEAVPDIGAGPEPCISPGTYAGEVFGGFDVDLLSASPQAFPTQGEGTENEAHIAAVWLNGGDINATDDPTVIFDVAGTATQASTTYPFTGKVTIGANRAVAPTNPALPGSSPICLQRIVTPIDVDVDDPQAPGGKRGMVLREGGTLELQIDARAIFADVDFAKLVPSTADPSQYIIPDTNIGIGAAVFRGLQRDTGVYTFTYVDANGE